MRKCEIFSNIRNNVVVQSFLKSISMYLIVFYFLSIRIHLVNSWNRFYINIHHLIYTIFYCIPLYYITVYWSKVYDIDQFRGPHLKLNLLPFAQISIKFNEFFSKHKRKCTLLNAFFRIESNLRFRSTKLRF